MSKQVVLVNRIYIQESRKRYTCTYNAQGLQILNLQLTLNQKFLVNKHIEL